MSPCLAVVRFETRPSFAWSTRFDAGLGAVQFLAEVLDNNGNLECADNVFGTSRNLTETS